MNSKTRQQNPGIGEIEKKQVLGYDKTCMIYPDHLEDLKRAIKLIGNGKKVLDAGCSDGQVMEMIIEHGNDAVGIDISKNSLKGAKMKKLKVKYGRIQDIPFENNFFDVVFCAHTIEHVIDSDSALKEFHRVLKKGGKAIVLTENLNSLKERVLLMFGKIPTVVADPHHVKFFNIKRLSNEMLQAGFRIESVSGSQIGIPIPKHCFFSHKFDFFFPDSLKEKIIIVGVKQ